MTARFACDPPLCGGHAVAGVLPGDAGGVVGVAVGGAVEGAADGPKPGGVNGLAVAVGAALVGAAVDGAGVTRTVSGKHAAAKVNANSATRSPPCCFICLK
jgi:hypothetical protein